MRLLFTLVVLFFLGFDLSAQNERGMDSLKNILKAAENDFEKYEAYNLIIRGYLSASMDSTKVYNDQLLYLANTTKVDSISIKAFNLASTYYYYNSNLDSSLFYVKKALQLMENQDNQRLKADLYRKMAILSRTNSNFDAYESYAAMALTEARKTKDWELISSCLLVMGNIFYNKNDYPNALKYYLQIDSIHIENELKTSILSTAFENISIIYMALHNKHALDYFDKGEKVHQHLDNQAGLNNINRLRGNFQSKLKKYDLAISFLEKTVPFYESFNELNKLVEVYTELIRCYAYIGEFEKAEPLVRKTDEITRKKGFSILGLNAFQFSAAVYYLEKGNYSQAVEYFELAKKSASDKGTEYYMGERVEISTGLARAYVGMGNFEKAFETNQRLLILKDSLAEQNKVKLTTELEAKYQTKQKEREIELLKAQNQLAEQQKRNQRNLLLGGLGITSLVGLFFFISYKNRQKTNRKLKELDSLKSNFFANISHEFRTPLTLISTPIQEKLDQELPPKERSTFEMIQRNNGRLLELVDQLLDLSKIEAGSLQLKVAEGNVLVLVGAIADSFTHAARSKNIKYLQNINHTPTEVWYDSDAVQKIMVNLLSNAFKYTPKNGSVICNAFVKDHTLYVEVRNTGEGLSEKQIKKIFDRFYQADSSSQGSGIGLSLVKELVSIHKGTLEVESVKKEWTVFSVALPVNKASFKQTPIKPGNDLAVEKFHKISSTLENESISEEIEDSDLPIMLIVEDNADVRTLLNSLFEKEYSVLMARNGEEGKKIALEHVPDIIISDVMMPVKDGIALAKELKNDERTNHIPIILLTAKAGEENELKGVGTGADDYITKPFNQKILTSKVEKLIQSRKQLQHRYSQEVILKPMELAITNLDEKFLEKVQTVLDTNLVEPSFSTDEFSSTVGMSRMQLHRKLKALTGLSASEFIRSQRLKLAAELLKKPDIKVSEVGYSVGFNNHSYFTKCFKEAYHCTPNEYAKRF